MAVGVAVTSAMVGSSVGVFVRVGEGAAVCVDVGTAVFVGFALSVAAIPVAMPETINCSTVSVWATKVWAICSEDGPHADSEASTRRVVPICLFHMRKFFMPAKLRTDARRTPHHHPSPRHPRRVQIKKMSRREVSSPARWPVLRQ